MTPEQTAYLAGFLEGEGCFNITKRRKYKKDDEFYMYANIVVGSTDMDVLVKAQEMSGGLGKIFSRKIPENPRHKQCHVWDLGNSEAIQLMEAVLPQMGERRTQRIKEVLEATKKE
jgi:hypothetical protein